MDKAAQRQDLDEKTYIKGLSFIGAHAMEGKPTAVDVREGKIIRLRPFHYDWKYKPEEFDPWKIEARGKSFEPKLKSLLDPLALAYKKRVYSANRILFPLKRADFNPHGERNIQNRGKSGFVRISWEEALDIIEGEIRRVVDQYGPYAILCQSDGHGETKCVHGPHGAQRDLLRLLGGYTQQCRNPDSWEGWYWGAKHVWGQEPVGQGRQCNLVPDIAENTGLLLYWGCDAESTGWGWSGQIASRLMYWFTELGIKSVFVCPDLNYSAAVHADKWIPVLPNTDMSLQLAIAYVWITEDAYDKEYVKTHAIGFEKVRDYVMGKEDGIPKTPRWASTICGVPSRIIKALARDWASKATSLVHSNGGGYIRGQFSTEPGRMEIILMGMQGLGKPGANQFKLIEWAIFNDPNQMALPRSKVFPDMMAAHHGFNFQNIPRQHIPKTLIADAILNPPLSWYGTTVLAMPRENQFTRYTYPAPGCSEIHMIWTDSPCWITCWNQGNRFIQAVRDPKIEFMLAQHPWLENDCLFADIVLPVNTKFEEDDIAGDGGSGQFNTVIDEKRCIEPLGESRSDYEIACLVAERLGLLEKYTQGKTVEEWIKVGFETSGAKDYISFAEWKQKGYIIFPTDPEWKKSPPGLRTFHDDPEKNPLPTPTGKLEFYSQTLAEKFPDDNERPPYPKWIPFNDTHQESLLHPRAKDYPLLVVSNHPRWGVHANHDDITWFREIKTCRVKGPDGYLYHTVWLNPVDAASRGIADGDVVKIYNERGATLCGAMVTERMMPGVISTDHGAKYDPIVPGELDRGGVINTIVPPNLTSKNCAGMATCGFLAQVERANLAELQKKYPDAMNRPFHPAAGPYVDGFLLNQIR
ncbi:MAG: molybdopterin oxidoreductase [Chloroflexi bacterium]|nr:molybdopterin oxidoreductase [Chloroflexota bacterium]